MPINKGSTNFGSIYLGSTKIGRAYLGNVEVFRAVTMVTIGGKAYPTVEMPDGSVWLGYNLDYKFSGVTVVTENQDQSSTSRYACYYGYDESTNGWNGNKYGLLYNWYAVDYMEQHKSTLFPGWHVPTFAELQSLATAVGESTSTPNTVGLKLKSTTNWNDHPGTNEYGFSWLPGGHWYATGFSQGGTEPSNVNRSGELWSSTAHRTLSSNAYYTYVLGNFDTMFADNTYAPKYFGCSVRLVKDT